MAEPAKPIEPPRDLTIPEAGSTTAQRVLSRAIGRLLAEVSGLARTAVAGAPVQPDAAAFHEMVRRMLQDSVGPLASALRSPTVGTLVRCLRPLRASRELAASGAFVELAALVALHLAWSGALPGPVRLRRMPPRLLLLPARVAIAVPPDAVALELANGRVAIERRATSKVEEIDLERAASMESAGEGAAAGGGARISRPYAAVDREIALALADNNPLAMNEAHPDKSGNAVDLGGRSAGEWVAALRGALGIIERYLPDLRREMDLYVQQIVPVGWDAERHLSASYQEAIGTIYLSLHPNEMTMAEALIHEFSHNKLNALLELDRVLENATSPLYASPVRPDPRPLHGVLLAVHAFLPVARLYERMIAAGDPRAEDPSFAERFARVRQSNREGAEVVLAHGRPTPVGEALLAEIRRWDERYAEA